MLPTVILPGYFESADLYLPLQQALTEMVAPTTTVPLRTRDWLPTLGSQSRVPILRQLNRTVNSALIDNNNQQINLIGHCIEEIFLNNFDLNISLPIDSIDYPKDH